jgi:hypothetical protein
MKILVAIQCHFFQKRLCWMLSSILEQIPRKRGLDLPEIAVDIAFMRNNGNPTTENVIEYFSKLGLKINSTIYDKDEYETFQLRGITRNFQTINNNVDWILYADSDMVYPTTFFSELGGKIRKEIKGGQLCYYSQRQSTYLEETEKIINEYNYPIFIKESFDKANKLQSILKPNLGAGYCQIVNLKMLQQKYNGVYVDPENCNDWKWTEKYQKAKSDIQFRQKLGGQAINLPVQIHLQHNRDKEQNKHIEEQR